MKTSLATWMRRRRDRQTLMSLDDRLLADMGVARGQIDACVSGKISR